MRATGCIADLPNFFNTGEVKESVASPEIIGNGDVQTKSVNLSKC